MDPVHDAGDDICDLTRRRACRAHSSQGGVGARGDGRAPGAHRARQPEGQRHRHARRRAGDGRRGRRPTRCRRGRRARPAARTAGRAQGSRRHRRHPHHVRLAVLQRQRANGRRADRQAHPRGGRHHAGQDQHAGIRRGLEHVQSPCSARRATRSTSPRPCGGSSGGAAVALALRPGADRRRQRHRRLAAQPGGVQQHRGLPPVAGAGARRRPVRGRRSRRAGRWRARWPMSRCS